MTRGNQRELAREKNLKKLQDAKKKSGGDKDGMSLEQRKQRDADLMRQKQMKKAESAGQSSSNS